MLVLGETDTRTPSGAGGEEMFRALEVSQDANGDGEVP